MSKYIIGIFPSYQDAKMSAKQLEDEGLSNEIVVLNRLARFENEDASMKLDGVISGVSDVFIGLPAFVNPMSAVGLPPQQMGSALVEGQWEKYGFDRENALKYQNMMKNGKTVLAVKSDENDDAIKECMNRFNIERTLIHSI